MAITGPEHTEVRLPLLGKMLDSGWSRGQIQCPPDDKEWRVPSSPSEAAKREQGRAFHGYPVDLALFDAPGHAGDCQHILGIVECKAPDMRAGVDQLEICLGLEPHCKYGYWTNGAESVAVYKLPDGSYERVEHAAPPAPEDNLIHTGKAPITYNDLKIPSSAELSAVFNRLLGGIAAADTVSTRPEQRLNEIANILIVKLESDKAGSAPNKRGRELGFQLGADPAGTARRINGLYARAKRTRSEIFLDDDPDAIRLDAASLHRAVSELQMLNLKDAPHQALSTAFQVFRSANLKLGDGQYFTPRRLIEAAVKMMELTTDDKIIDPALGTGGFLYEAYVDVSSQFEGDLGAQADARTWAHDKLYGVDRDSINVKLSRALMVGIGDGSAHVYVGDSIRSQLWDVSFPVMKREAMRDGGYSAVITNPPFGKDLRVSAADCRAGSYTVGRHARGGGESEDYCDTELGIVFVERAFRLLEDGGRLGIVLPETYLFSSSYKWFRKWLFEHFVLRGVLNVPMEAFQEFCRAKTNFYVLQKKGTPSPGVAVPGWFEDGKVWVSNAPTIGINKDGAELYKVDADGDRTAEIDDVALDDVAALLEGRETATSHYVDLASGEFVGVPKYTDYAAQDEFRRFLGDELDGFEAISLGELADRGLLAVSNGHGSPSSDQRVGGVPYIKVSDIRAGLVNVNPGNMVPLKVAMRHWRGNSSGLRPYDVITPSRACKNIGEIAVLMPDQLDIVLTKEVLVFSAGDSASFDNFYVAWALDLPSVRAQWDRIIFMQTNREDVGDRWREICIPLPPDGGSAARASRAYRDYYSGLHTLRSAFNAAREA